MPWTDCRSESDHRLQRKTGTSITTPVAEGAVSHTRLLEPPPQGLGICFIWWLIHIV